MAASCSIVTCGDGLTIDDNTEIQVWLDDCLRDKAKQKLTARFASTQPGTDVDECMVKFEKDIDTLKQKLTLTKEECVTMLSTKCYMAINPLPPIKNNSSLVQRLLKILKKLQKRREAIPFYVPVDPEILPNAENYFKLIKHPMDFHTIHKKLAADQYGNELEFLNDVWLMVSNACKSNHLANLHSYAINLATALVEAMADYIDPSVSAKYFSEIQEHIWKNTPITERGITFGRPITHSNVKTIPHPNCSPPVEVRALNKLPEYNIRRTPGSQSAYFTFTTSFKSLGGIHRIQVFRLPDTRSDTPSFDEVLARKYSRANSHMGCVVDEVALKLYLACWVPYIGSAKTTRPYLQRAWLEEFELEFPGGIMRASQARRRQINIDLQYENIIVCHLFIWPNTGTLMTYVVNVDTDRDLEIPKVGALLWKKKSDRVISVRYVNSSLSTKCIIRCQNFMQYGSDCLAAVINCHFDQQDQTNPEPWLFLTVQVNHESEIGLELLWEGVMDPRTLWSSQIDSRISAFDLGAKFLGAKFLGRIFRVMVIAFYSTILPPQLLLIRLRLQQLHGDPQSTACSVRLNLPFVVCPSSQMKLLSLNGGSLLLTELHNLAIARISLKSGSARQFKFYRVCANCGKREHKKRTNANGKRISDYKVCRECKKLKFHHDWQNRACHYCSFECIKANWKKHSAFHQQVMHA